MNWHPRRLSNSRAIRSLCSHISRLLDIARFECKTSCGLVNPGRAYNLECNQHRTKSRHMTISKSRHMTISNMPLQTCVINSMPAVGFDWMIEHQLTQCWSISSHESLWLEGLVTIKMAAIIFQREMSELISYWRKWPPFRTWRFQTHFREWLFILLKLHCSLFLRVQLTITKHWFR